MATTPVPAAPTMPAAPDPANRSTFNALAYAWSNALGPFSNGLQALAVNAKANADDAAASVGAATTAKTDAQAARDAASASAASAVNAPGTSATSTTSLAIGTGSKTLTIQAGKAFAVGQFVVLASAANAANYMHGQITAHNSATGLLTVTATSAVGSGTFADWSVALTSPGNLTTSGAQVISNKTFINSGFGYFDAGATSALSCPNGSHQRWAPTGTVTLTVTNWPASGTLGELLIEGVNLGAATITWPTVNWIKSDGTTTTVFSNNGVTLQASGTDWAILWTRNGGATVFGKWVR